MTRLKKTICRKPSPFLIKKAAKEHSINLEKSYMIGDKASDIEAGINAGIKTILLRNTIYKDEINILINEGKKPNFVAENFKQACDYIFNSYMEVSN